MSSIGVQVTREGSGLSIPATLAGTTGTTSGDNVDWEDGTGAPGSIPGPAGNFELKREGGQSLIDDDSFPSAGTTEDFDPTDGNEFTRTLDDDLTATILAPVGDGAAVLLFWFTQDGTGGHTVTIEADGGTVTGDISGYTRTAGETFRVVAHRIPGTTNDWVIGLVGDAAEGSGGLVPYYIPVDDTFTVPLYRQGLFSEPIEVDGALVVNGVLIGVD